MTIFKYEYKIIYKFITKCYLCVILKDKNNIRFQNESKIT